MSVTFRQYTFLDRCITNFDNMVRTLNCTVTAGRANPAQQLAEAALTAAEKKHSAGLMRVNYAGEVCAQALYQGQTLTACSNQVKEKMQQSAQEENDHLAWCQTRLKELNSHPSYLNPLWYAGSLLIGAVAGIAGDKWSLGFVVETERQVVQHLDSHLARLPKEDAKSRLILQQMREDEGHHATVAMEAGATALPNAVRQLMRLMSKIMTTTAYYF